MYFTAGGAPVIVKHTATELISKGKSFLVLSSLFMVKSSV
jgi:hypothetical protein